MTRIAILDDYQDVARRFADWDSLDAEVVVFTEHSDDVDHLEPFDVIMAMRERTPFPRERLARLPNLRLLVTTGMGNAAIDTQAARELGITVAGTGGTPTHTAELTWGLILALARHIPREDAAVRGGGWQHTVGFELAGRTLGVIGLGRLGSQVARIGEAFRMERCSPGARTWTRR
jgi:phosphoglycerate dehydrogenase-like enzyme